MLPSSQVSVQVLVRICEQEDGEEVEEVGVQPPLLLSPAAGHFSHSAHGPQVPRDQYEIPHSDLPLTFQALVLCCLGVVTHTVS